jgi:hypothetical protein
MRADVLNWLAMSSSAQTMDYAGEGVGEETRWLPATDENLLRFRQAVRDGEDWFIALLDAIGRWRVPSEEIGDRVYDYLPGGEAFDWLLLAERIIDEAPDLIPRPSSESLLFEGRWPTEIDDEEFALRIGPVKHSAHLNFLYGVLVEEALQLSVEEEIHKENRNRPWGQDPRVDQTMLERVYDKSREELYSQYYTETGIFLREKLSHAQWKAFTYWLFKFRLRRQDKARVASDTRKGLAQLTRMELAASERRHGARLGEADFQARYGATVGTERVTPVTVHPAP